MKKVKQMSYLSMIIFIIGTTIGAGIFYKNQNIAALSHGQFGPVLATWGVAIFGIVALAVALIEVSSAQKTDKGTLEWTKLFTPKWFHKSSTNFVRWMFIPLALFTMPLYIMESLQDAGWNLHHGISVLAISFGIFVWFMVINLISFRFSEISQWVFTAIQTVPLIILPIIAYAHPLAGSEILQKDIISTDAPISIPTGINGISPWISLIAGVSAITFAYDGFYVIASMKEKTSGKAKMGVGLVIGVTAISAIYLFLTVAFNVGSSDGTHLGIQWVKDHDAFSKAMNICIAIGIIGILNGFAMGSPRQLRSLAETGEANEIKWFQKIVFRSKSKANDKRQLEITAWLYLFAISTILFLTLGFVGVYAYTFNEYSGAAGTLYTFSDHIVNFTTLIMFIIITTSILGALINRKTNKVKVIKSKFFVVAAWITIVVFYAAGLYVVITALLDMFDVTGDLETKDIVSAIIKFAIFIGILAASIVPAIISTKRKVRA